MKTIISILLFSIFYGCKNAPIEIINKNKYPIVIIDSCEYIEVFLMSGMQYEYYSLTHKGNCKFCKARIKH